MRLTINEPLAYRLNENEIGPIMFNFNNPTQLLTKALIAYDIDLAENATFLFHLTELAPADPYRLSTKEVNYYFGFDSILFNNTACGFVTTKTSFNLMNSKPIDFESLPLAMSIDPTIGVAIKTIKFGVSSSLVSNFWIVRW